MENFSLLSTFAEDALNEKQMRIENGSSLLNFGIKFLDDAFIGIGREDLVLLAGRSGQGKSEMALHIAMYGAFSGKKVIHLALESDRKEMSRRMLYKLLAKRFYTDPERKVGKLRYLEWFHGKQELLVEKYYQECYDQLAKQDNLRFFYRGDSFGKDEMEKIFISAKTSCDLLVIDHLHYMDIDEENETKGLKEIVKKCRELIKEYQIPVIMVCHVRKRDKFNPNPVPQSDDIHGSSDIFKICTKAIAIAPAKIKLQDPNPTRMPTYIRILKSRQDGSLDRHTAVVVFDVKTNKYDEDYKLGYFNDSGDWEEYSPEFLPSWVTKTKKEIKNYAEGIK